MGVFVFYALWFWWYFVWEFFNSLLRHMRFWIFFIFCPGGFFDFNYVSDNLCYTYFDPLFLFLSSTSLHSHWFSFLFICIFTYSLTSLLPYYFIHLTTYLFILFLLWRLVFFLTIYLHVYLFFFIFFCYFQDLKDYMRKAGDVVFTDVDNRTMDGIVEFANR